MTITVGPASRASLRPLAIRQADDDRDAFVVGRSQGGEFIELPRIGLEAMELLDTGMSVEEVEERLSVGDDRPDVAGLVRELIDLKWVDSLDGHQLPDPIAAAGVQLAWLRPAHVRWLFARPTAFCYWAVLMAAAITVARTPDLVPSYQDFFWTDYVGLATLINTLLFFAGSVIHELMHFAAARLVGVPARIGLGTRLNNLALQTDVSAAWVVTRGERYRIYLAGIAWDTVSISIAILVLAYANPATTTRGLLSAYVLVALVSLAFQAMVFMRTDLYFVLMDLLRCGDLFHDGLDYARYLAVRTVRTARRQAHPPDPARDLSTKEARAVRIYAPLVVVGGGAALSAYALFGIPVLLETTLHAGSALTNLASGGSPLRAIDGGLVLAVEWGLQILFLLIFYRSHPSWFGRGPLPIGKRR